MTKKYFLLLLISPSIFSGVTYAWWSAVVFRESTHHKLTRKAIEQIDGIEYPDIDRFKDSICNWTSGPSDDENAHGKKYEEEYGEEAEKFNGGPYQLWWEDTTLGDGLIVKYRKHDFSNGDYSTYYYLAMMVHLIADQAVPAHAANILHGFPSAILNPDNLEKQSYNEDPQRGDTMRKSTLDRYYYFYDSLTDEIDGTIPFTQSKLPDWESKDGICYWLENDSEKYKGKAFDSSWGKYGGDDSKDIYDEEKDSQDIIQTQFLQSVAYTAGFLRTVSEKLPPLISGLALTSNTILQNSSTTIKFQVDENRQPNVRINLSVGNRPIRATDIVWDSAEKMLQPNDEDDELPYRGQFSIDWDGKLADETYPTDGQHDLVVQVQDADGNWSDSCGVSFVIDRSPVKAASRFTALSKDCEVILRWVNPDESGCNVWVYRTEDGNSPNPGSSNFIEKRGMNGNEDSFLDKGLINGITYTYTLYIENQAGGFSLPAVVDAVPQEVVSNLDELLKDLIYENTIDRSVAMAKRLKAREKIKKLGGKAVAKLLEVACDVDRGEKERVVAIVILGEMKIEEAIWDMEKILGGDGNEYCREASALSLAEIGDKISIGKLRVALNDQSGNVRQRAVLALAKLGDRRYADVSLKGLREGNPTEKLLATMALEGIGDTAVIQELQKDTESKDVWTRINARLAVRKIEYRNARGEDRLAYLKEALKDREFEINSWAVEELIKVNSPDAMKIIEEAAKDSRVAGSYAAGKYLRMRGR